MSIVDVLQTVQRYADDWKEERAKLGDMTARDGRVVHELVVALCAALGGLRDGASIRQAHAALHAKPRDASGLRGRVLEIVDGQLRLWRAHRFQRRTGERRAEYEERRESTNKRKRMLARGFAGALSEVHGSFRGLDAGFVKRTFDAAQDPRVRAPWVAARLSVEVGAAFDPRRPEMTVERSRKAFIDCPWWQSKIAREAKKRKA